MIVVLHVLHGGVHYTQYIVCGFYINGVGHDVTHVLVKVSK